MKVLADPNYTIRIPNDTREKLQRIADAECRTLAQQIMFFIQKGVEDYVRSQRVQQQQ